MILKGKFMSFLFGNKTLKSAELSGASHCAGAMICQCHRPPTRSTLAANHTACRVVYKLSVLTGQTGQSYGTI